MHECGRLSPFVPERGAPFSEAARDELRVLSGQVMRVVDDAYALFMHQNGGTLQQVEEEEQQVDDMVDELETIPYPAAEFR